MRKQGAKRHRRTTDNPVGRALLVHDLHVAIAAELKEWRTAAELQAWTGNNLQRLVNAVGRLTYIVLHTVATQGISPEHPDVRIILGAGEALGDLVADGRLEFHRPAIRSGLMAIERLLLQCDMLNLAHAAIELDNMLAKGDMSTSSLHNLFQPEPAEQT